MQVLQTRTDLQVAARAFVAGLSAKKDHATLVTLSGELGAGKTAFVQECAAALGVSEEVTSPTFVIENRYPLTGAHGFTELIHIDAYRLESGDSLGSLRFAEDIQNPHLLIMLEWPERVAGALPLADVSIVLVLLEDGTRTLSSTAV